jgi:general secretion pathway protein J
MPVRHRLPRSRQGFTLLELMMALTLTAIAAGVAATALSAARSARARVAAHRTHGEADTRLRALLADLLRHAPAAEAVSEPLLTIGRDASGATLQFLSRGVRPPYGTGPIWRVQLARDGERLLLRADALGVAGTAGTDAPVVMAVEDVASFEVLALEPANGREAARWRTDWPLAQRRPAAVALSWTRGDAAGPANATRAPFVVALDPLEAGRP